jgi:hypothetical protein
MSRTHPATSTGPVLAEHAQAIRALGKRVITRSGCAPLSDDDRQMERSWRCILVQPTHDPHWLVLDSSRDHKTEWGRWRDLADGGSG